MIAEGCPGAPKLDPRVRRTRALLEGALRSLMAERPYDEISVGDIAARATVNRATFYAHFEDKRALAASLLSDELHNALVASLSERMPFGPESLGRATAALFESIAKTFGACPKHADDFSPHVGPILQETVQTFLRTWIEHDPDAMRYFPGASRDTVATVLAGGLYGAAARWAGLHRRPPAERAAQEVVSLLIR